MRDERTPKDVCGEAKQDHVQMKVLEKLIPCPDLLGDKFLVFETKKRHIPKVNKYN